MGKIIAVVSGKGGTGKTSFTANTGLALASLDQHVLCMDCDITLRNLDLARHRESQEHALYRLNRLDNRQKIAYYKE